LVGSTPSKQFDGPRPRFYLERFPEAAMLTTADFKRGLRSLIDGEPYSIVDYTVQTPSARGAATLVRAKVRNYLTGAVFDKTFKSGDKFDAPDLQRRAAQFLYRDGDDLHFMDNESYEQLQLPAEQLGDTAVWLADGMAVHAIVFNGRVVSIEVPRFVEVEVRETEPGIRGVTASGKSFKDATVQGGAVIKVPLYIEAGERIEVDIEELRFIRRA
jgi:elongation factor P